jgi:c-di-GMP-binding flagellar brake protein YcgR
MRSKEMIQKRFDGKERRAYVRLKRSLPVRFRIDDSQTGKTYMAQTRNISRGGLCVEIDQETEELLEKISAAGHKIGIDVDTLIPKKATAVSAKSVWIYSRVDWTRKAKKKRNLLMGLEFEDVAEETRRRIHDFIVEEMVNRYEKSD